MTINVCDIIPDINEQNTLERNSSQPSPRLSLRKMLYFCIEQKEQSTSSSLRSS